MSSGQHRASGACQQKCGPQHVASLEAQEPICLPWDPKPVQERKDVCLVTPIFVTPISSASRAAGCKQLCCLHPESLRVADLCRTHENAGCVAHGPWPRGGQGAPEAGETGSRRAVPRSRLSLALCLSVALSFLTSPEAVSLAVAVSQEHPLRCAFPAMVSGFLGVDKGCCLRPPE